MQKLRTNDPVQVIVWKNKGTVTKIVQRDWDKVLLEWVNMVTRHKKWQTPKQVQLWVNVSNVMYYSAKHQSVSKITIVVDWDKKKRKLVKFNEIID